MVKTISPSELHTEVQRAIYAPPDARQLSALLSQPVRCEASEPIQHLLDTECLRMASKILDAKEAGQRISPRLKKAWRELMDRIRQYYRLAFTTDRITLDKLERRAAALRFA